MSTHTHANITDPEQVASLPWRGNYAGDRHLFDAVERYVRAEANDEKRHRAVYLAQLYGMGVDEPVGNQEVLEFLGDIPG